MDPPGCTAFAAEGRLWYKADYARMVARDLYEKTYQAWTE